MRRTLFLNPRLVFPDVRIWIINAKLTKSFRETRSLSEQVILKQPDIVVIDLLIPPVRCKVLLRNQVQQLVFLRKVPVD